MRVVRRGEFNWDGARLLIFPLRTAKWMAIVIKVPDWITGALSRSDAVPSGAKTVMLGGVPTVLEGASDDPYFQAVVGQAAALDGLAALIQRQVPRDSTVIDVVPTSAYPPFYSPV